MAKSVDQINLTNWSATGANIPFPQYRFTVEVNYTKDDGTPGHYGPTVHQFPNDLTTMPLAVRKAFAEQMITAVVRCSLGIDTWDSYS